MKRVITMAVSAAILLLSTAGGGAALAAKQIETCAAPASVNPGATIHAVAVLPDVASPAVTPYEIDQTSNGTVLAFVIGTTDIRGFAEADFTAGDPGVETILFYDTTHQHPTLRARCDVTVTGATANAAKSASAATYATLNADGSLTVIAPSYRLPSSVEQARTVVSDSGHPGRIVWYVTAGGDPAQIVTGATIPASYLAAIPLSGTCTAWFQTAGASGVFKDATAPSSPFTCPVP